VLALNSRCFIDCVRCSVLKEAIRVEVQYEPWLNLVRYGWIVELSEAWHVGRCVLRPNVFSAPRLHVYVRPGAE
jgi:hypothetical protein